MPGEYGYSPEQMEEIEKPSTISNPDLIKEGAAPAVKETADQKDKSGLSQYEPSPEEKEEIKAEINRQLVLGLGDLYELLPHDPESKVEAKEVIDLIEHTRLNTAIPLPFWRKLLAAAIEDNGLNHKSKAESISSGLAALDAMAGMQTIIEAGDRQLDASIAAKREES